MPDQVEANMAAEQAEADGYAIRLQAIPVPTDAKRFADHLADSVGKLGVSIGVYAIQEGRSKASGQWAWEGPDQ